MSFSFLAEDAGKFSGFEHYGRARIGISGLLLLSLLQSPMRSLIFPGNQESL